MPYQHLLQPINLGPVRLKNRLFNPPHGTTLGNNGVVTDELIAYHEKRAIGGVGLIILESMTIHPSYGFEEAFLYAGSDKIIPGLSRLGQACRNHGTPVFGQLFHAGRAVRLSHDGSRPVVYSASDIPDERYRVVPVPMPNDMVWEIIESYVDGAARLAKANLDGVEVLASMGYLIAQFLNPATNRREDEFGGSFDNRLRFLREVLYRIRTAIGQSKTLGIRITLDEKVESGLDAAEVVKICRALEADNQLDYFSVIAGSTSTPAGWVHVFPPMAIPQGFVADDAAQLKQAVTKPVLVAGRINQPQLAESILAEGKADMVGMARALITDPEFVNKLVDGRINDIRACIGCNQACVGHRLAHHPISCIQNPESGREIIFDGIRKAETTKCVLVAGAGPAGMKAAVTAAQRGHRVHLYEKSNRAGGQVNLAEKLPGREEFGGVSTNLLQELKRENIRVKLNTPITESVLQTLNPDAVVVATGALPRLPDAKINGVDMVDAWSVIQGDAKPGHRVVIADWACDWGGLGVAQLLAKLGHYVRLYCGGSVAGESLQGIVRDQWIGELHKLEVEIIPFARLYGAESGTVFFQHMTSNEAIVCDNVDTIVSCYAPQANRELDVLLEKSAASIYRVGDAVAPRTVEEAVLEGYRIGREL